MKGRLQPLLALLAVAVVVAGGLAASKVGTKAPVPAPSPWVGSGAWYCPHGGGPGWIAGLSLANPGEHTVTARISNYGDPREPAPQTVSVAPRSEVSVAVPGTSRGSSSMVEYFGGWLAAGWTLTAGSGQAGVAADACTGAAGRSMVLPFGTTVRGSSTYAVVMNPFGTPAVFTLSVYSPSEKPTTSRDLTDFVLKPEQSTAISIGPVVLGQNVAGARIDVSSGRVAAGSLVLAGTAGIATAPAVALPAPSRSILPGDSDSGQAQLMAVNTSSSVARLSAVLATGTSEVTVAGLQSQQLDPSSAKAFQITQIGPATLDVRTSGGNTALVLVDTSSSGDPGATVGASSPATRWVVLPSAGPSPWEPRVVIANLQSTSVSVTIQMLGSSGSAAPQPVTMQVPSGRTVLAPSDLLAADPTGAVLATSTGGGVVAGASSYSSNRSGFSLSVGLPIPGG